MHTQYTSPHLPKHTREHLIHNLKFNTHWPRNLWNETCTNWHTASTQEQGQDAHSSYEEWKGCHFLKMDTNWDHCIWLINTVPQRNYHFIPSIRNLGDIGVGLRGFRNGLENQRGGEIDSTRKDQVYTIKVHVGKCQWNSLLRTTTSNQWKFKIR